eukprot:8701135-Prorocentrum_lima.AAC.1
MTALMNDAKLLADSHLDRDCALSRVPNMPFDSILYADDTALVSTDSVVLEALLQATEQVGLVYGMRLNQKKCELLRFNSILPIRFLNGTPMKSSIEVKYLGCYLNERTDPRLEIRHRLTICGLIWRRLRDFWLHSS